MLAAAFSTETINNGIFFSHGFHLSSGNEDARLCIRSPKKLDRA